MLNKQTLTRSLNSLVELGNPEIENERIREYVVLYNDILKYIDKYSREDSILKEYYKKFPKIEYQEFNKPSDMIMSYIIIIIQSVLFRRFQNSIENPGEMSPRRIKFNKYIRENMPIINTIASELAQRLSYE